MKWLWVYMILLLAALEGCAGTGFEKRATLVPDSISVTYLQERFRGDNAAWRGGSISATWNFK